MYRFFVSAGRALSSQAAHYATSSYTIYVDLPDNSDEMLLVHGYLRGIRQGCRGMSRCTSDRTRPAAPPKPAVRRLDHRAGT